MHEDENCPLWIDDDSTCSELTGDVDCASDSTSVESIDLAATSVDSSIDSSEPDSACSIETSSSMSWERSFRDCLVVALSPSILPTNVTVVSSLSAAACRSFILVQAAPIWSGGCTWPPRSAWSDPSVFEFDPFPELEVDSSSNCEFVDTHVAFVDELTGNSNIDFNENTAHVSISGNSALDTAAAHREEKRQEKQRTKQRETEARQEAEKGLRRLQHEKKDKRNQAKYERRRARVEVPVEDEVDVALRSLGLK
jgi:hypothetical protein